MQTVMNRYPYGECYHLVEEGRGIIPFAVSLYHKKLYYALQEAERAGQRTPTKERSGSAAGGRISG